MKKYLLLIPFLFIFAACGGEEETPPAPPEEAGCLYCVIQSAQIVGDYTSIPYVGDIWTTTWAADGSVYAAFGDATGMNKCLPTLFLDEVDEFDADYTEVSPGLYTVPDENNEYCEVFGCEEPLPLCQYTPAGLLSLSGDPPDFELCDDPDQCVVSRHIPYGNYDVFANSDKPSSILAVNGRIYMPMHYPPGDAEVGYIAYSDDDGRTWTQIPGSPWKNDSPFQTLMFFNMGQNYGLNRDGYVYGLGIADELPDGAPQQDVYLARVPLPDGGGSDPVLDYAAYEYFTGLDESGAPQWSEDPAAAVPLDGLKTIAQGAAFYHEGAGQYLFLSGFLERDGSGALFAAPDPWGPWYKVNDLPAGYIPGVIAKGATADSFYFTAAGGGPVTYNLNVGQIKLTLDKSKPPPPLTLLDTRKVEQIVGDWDLETLQPTRQQTESRFNVLFTDLGSPFEYQGKLWFLFGDTDPEAPGWDEYHDDAIAWTEAQSAADFQINFLTDPDSGRGILNPKIACPEENNPDCVDLGAVNVPVAGLGDGETMFVWFTADTANRSLLARSDDDGRTFQKVYDFGDTHFVDIAAQRYDGELPGLAGAGPWALIFGSGDKENNDVYLAAASLQSLRDGDRSAIRFLSGIAYDDNGAAQLSWSTAEGDSVPLFRIEHGPGPGIMSEVPHGWGFGEPLIHYNEKLGLWLATYNAARTTIRLRTAENPWGPWSASLVLFDPARDYGRGPAYGRTVGDDQTDQLGGQGELYGPYVIPRFTELLADGRIRLYWLLSPWQPYVVYLMESTLAWR
jgi:hypothetical protein